MTGHSSAVTSVAFSEDGQCLISYTLLSIHDTLLSVEDRPLIDGKFVAF